MIYLKQTLVLVLFLLSIEGIAQTNHIALNGDFEHIESYIKSKTLPTDLPIERLVFEIIKREWNAEEKAYAIFYWLASNIKYDYNGFESGYWRKYPSDSLIASDTYMYRKGICSGYAHLFKVMCHKIGLESNTIDGYVRAEINRAGLPIDISDHTWNVVKINKKWKLVDVTWGSTTAIDGKVNRYYFFTLPEEFISNHFPENTEWQLIKVPITKTEFDKYPYISSQYFDLKFHESFPKDGLLKSNSGVINITINNPLGLDILLKIYDYKKEEWVRGDNISIVKHEEGTDIQLKFRDTGQYLLQVDGMCSESETYNITKGILYYTLVIE